MKRLIITSAILATIAIPTGIVLSAPTTKAPQGANVVVTQPEPAATVNSTPAPAEAAPVVQPQAIEQPAPVVVEVSELDKFMHIRNTIENAIEGTKDNYQYYQLINSVLRTLARDNPDKFTYELVEQNVQYVLNYYAPAKADMSLAHGLFNTFSW